MGLDISIYDHWNNITFFSYSDVHIFFYLIYAESRLERIQITTQFIDLLEKNNFELGTKLAIETIRKSAKTRLIRIPIVKFPNFTMYKNSVLIYCKQYRPGGGRNQNKRSIEFQVTLPVNPNFRFELSKRGPISKFFRMNKGDLGGINDEFNIKSSNLVVVKSLLNDRPYLNILPNLISETLEPIYINRSKFSVFVLFSDAVTLMSKVNSVIQLNNAIQSILSEHKVESSTDISVSTSNALELKKFTLVELETLNPTCIICYQDLISDIKDLEDNADAFYLLCCSSFVHFSHLITWLTKEDTCPYCQFEDPDAELVEIRGV